MKQWMWLALVLGCKSKESVKQEEPPPKPAEPVKRDEPAPTKPESDRPEGTYKMTKEIERPATSGFARVDDAVSGKAPWITDAEAKAGIVVLVALPLENKISTKRLCGDEAKAAMTTYGDEVAKRSRDLAQKQVFCAYHDAEKIQWICTAFAPDEDGYSVNLDYRQVDGAWVLVGVDQSGKTANTRKQRVDYDKLLATKCK